MACEVVMVVGFLVDRCGLLLRFGVPNDPSAFSDCSGGAVERVVADCDHFGVTGLNGFGAEGGDLGGSD